MTFHIEFGEFPQPDTSQLPTIEVVVGQVSQCVDETQEKLLAANKPVFVRAGSLVTPIFTEYPASKDRTTKVTVLRLMDIGKFRYMLNKRVVRCLKYNEQKRRLVETDPPEKMIQTLLTVGHWKFPRIVGCINSPTMRPDGSVIDTKGFDKRTQFWVDWDDDFVLPAITAMPSYEDAQAAKNLLLGLLSGFPFEKEVDKSVALAAVMTAVVRAAFDVAPMFLVLAHMAGTGKSYFADLISTIINGRPCPVITLGRNAEETEKRLGSLLLESPSIISLENLTSDLDGELLCQMCSQRTIKTRVLGRSETPDCEWRGTLLATGNNISLVGDMTRRGLIINLDANTERPEKRAFDFDPIDVVLKDRGRYVAATLTIARAYLASASNKVQVEPLGGYEGWSRVVREPLVWLGMTDPVDCMEQTRAADPQRNAAAAMTELWLKYFSENARLTAADIIKAAREQRAVGVAEFEAARPELKDLLVDECGNNKGEIEPRKLGRWLSRIDGQVHNGLCIKIIRNGQNMSKLLYALRKTDKQH